MSMIRLCASGLPRRLPQAAAASPSPYPPSSKDFSTVNTAEAGSRGLEGEDRGWDGATAAAPAAVPAAVAAVPDPGDAAAVTDIAVPGYAAGEGVADARRGDFRTVRCLGAVASTSQQMSSN